MTMAIVVLILGMLLITFNYPRQMKITAIVCASIIVVVVGAFVTLLTIDAINNRTPTSIVVNGPDGRVFEFTNGTSPEVIDKVMRANYKSEGIPPLPPGFKLDPPKRQDKLASSNTATGNAAREVIPVLDDSKQGWHPATYSECWRMLGTVWIDGKCYNK